VAVQLPTFKLYLSGDIFLNWEYFDEKFNSYAVLMGYRTVDAPEPTKELAALKYALPKETWLALKNTISWSETDNKDDPAQNLLKKLKDYEGTKNVIHERVEINELKRAQTEDINNWQTRCRQQGGQCEYSDQCTPELIRDWFIIE